MAISTRHILIAAVIMNAISIGLSEVQRRELSSLGLEATLELRKIEQQRLQQQAIELDRTYKLIAEMSRRLSEVNDRVTNVEIQIQSGPMQAQVYDTNKRLEAVQMKIGALNK